MRGLANLGLTCSQCGSDHGDTSGVCLRCRALAVAEERQKYHFAPELIELLRRAYAARNRAELTRRLDELVRQTGWPRRVFLYKAARQGWTSAVRRWSEDEIGKLRDQAGVIPITRCASSLNRTVRSAAVMAQRLGLSRAIGDGYSVSDLEHLFGEPRYRVRRWIDRGLFGRVRDHGRVSDDAVAKFIRTHTGEYELSRVEQVWFKAMAFRERAG